MTSKPNVILIHTDSMDGRAMGCMGHPAMHRATPNLDALAGQGTLFRNAYTNNPICCPSRASMWSGQFTYHCEGWNNYKGLEPGDVTFMEQLEQAGYDLKRIGKEDYLSGAHSVRARVSPWTRSANIQRPAYRMSPPRILDDDNPQTHKGDWRKVQSGIDWLRERGDQDSPFLLYLGISAPHPSFTTSNRYLAMIDDAGVSIPPPDEQNHPVMQYQRLHKNWEHGFSEEMVKTVRKIYFAMIAEVDAMVGHLMEAVDKLKLSDSTYVIFSSDHGELAMEHQQFYKMSMYEPSVRIPLIITGPGVGEGAQIEKPVSLVDIYPTLMDMAGMAHPSRLDGYSLMPELAGSSSQRPDWVLSEFHGTSLNTGSFMLRRGDWKYVAYVGYEPQLFNLVEDPDEVRNVAGSQPDIVKEMDELLRQIVDYEAVDAKVKAYDKRSFREWRREQRADGTYKETMAWIYSGFDRTPGDAVMPWTEEDERLIEQWLHR